MPLVQTFSLAQTLPGAITSSPAAMSALRRVGPRSACARRWRPWWTGRACVRSGFPLARPIPARPPCMRQRLLPRTAGARHDPPLRSWHRTAARQHRSGVAVVTAHACTPRPASRDRPRQASTPCFRPPRGRRSLARHDHARLLRDVPFIGRGRGQAYKLRDDAIVPLICPTCQNVLTASVLAAPRKASGRPATTLHGVVFDISVGSRARAVVGRFRGPNHIDACAAALPPRQASRGRDKKPLTPRFRETPLRPRAPHPVFRHASTRRRAAGQTAAPAPPRGRTSLSAKIRP